MRPAAQTWAYECIYFGAANMLTLNTHQYTSHRILLLERSGLPETSTSLGTGPLCIIWKRLMPPSAFPSSSVSPDGAKVILHKGSKFDLALFLCLSFQGSKPPEVHNSSACPHPVGLTSWGILCQVGTPLLDRSSVHSGALRPRSWDIMAAA